MMNTLRINPDATSIVKTLCGLPSRYDTMAGWPLISATCRTIPAGSSLPGARRMKRATDAAPEIGRGIAVALPPLSA